MSFLSEAQKPDIEDHVFIGRMIEAVVTERGGYEKWASGCICGDFYSTGGPGFFIPSEASAKRLYNEHLRRTTGRDTVAPDDDTEETEVPVKEFLKIPTRIRALQWTGDNPQEVQEFIGEGYVLDVASETDFEKDDPLFSDGMTVWNSISNELWLWTVKSATHCKILPGGWIVPELDGEGHYPITEDVMKKSYMEVEHE